MKLEPFDFCFSCNAIYSENCLEDQHDIGEVVKWKDVRAWAKEKIEKLKLLKSGKLTYFQIMDEISIFEVELLELAKE